MQLSERRKRFGRLFKEKFFLRFHMSLILVGSAVTGLLVSKALLLLHLDTMVIRYPAAVLCSYLAFFGFMKLWLLYISSSAVRQKLVVDTADLLNAVDMPLSSRGEPAGALTSTAGGGGRFGGGGASGLFEEGTQEGPQPVLTSVAAGAGDSSGGAAAEAVGRGASGIFEDAGVVLIILGLILAVVFGAGVFLVSQAPLILSDAAFNFLLAAAIARRAKRMDSPHWMGSVFKVTLVPFVIVMVLSVLLGYVAQSAVPQATRLSEVVWYLLSEL